MANVGVVNLGVRGRGRAIRKGWLESRADILAYMDIDLSTDLASLIDAVEAIELHGYDIAVGSRLLKGSRVIGRPFHREVMSKAYSMTFRLLYLTRFRDAQCGFKAISRETASALLPVVEDMGWFLRHRAAHSRREERIPDQGGAGYVDGRPGHAGEDHPNHHGRPEGPITTQAWRASQGVEGPGSVSREPSRRIGGGTGSGRAWEG